MQARPVLVGQKVSKAGDVDDGNHEKSEHWDRWEEGAFLLKAQGELDEAKQFHLAWEPMVQ